MKKLPYEQLIIKLSLYTDKKLNELLLAERHNPGWTSTRAIYLLALKQVAKQRNLIT